MLFAKHGRGAKALAVFDRIISLDLKNNYVTMFNVISACSHVNFISQDIQIFIIPTMELAPSNQTLFIFS